jgi:hypothetical protein
LSGSPGAVAQKCPGILNMKLKLIDIIKKLFARKRRSEPTGSKPKKKRKPPGPPAGFLTVEEFAAELGAGEIDVWRWSTMGILAPVEFGGRWYVSIKEAGRFMERAHKGTFIPQVPQSVMPLPKGVVIARPVYGPGGGITCPQK